MKQDSTPKEEKLRHEISPRVAKLISLAIDAILKNDVDDAYHQLYQIGSPNFDKMHEEVWAELDELAELQSLRDQLAALPPYLDPCKHLQGKEKVPTWYTANDMEHWLIRHDYSKGIATELAEHFANSLQGAFKVGFEKGQRSKESELQQRDETIKELKEALSYCLDQLMYESRSPGVFWMWARSNERPSDKLQNIYNKFHETKSKN